MHERRHHTTNDMAEHSVPDERDEQIPHEARGNAQLVPNLS